MPGDQKKTARDSLCGEKDTYMIYEEYDSLIVKMQGEIGYISDFETYEMRHLTDAGMKLYGLKRPEEYLGRKCYELLQGMDSPCSFCTNDKLVMGEKYCWEHFNEKLQRWLAVEDSLVEVDGRLCRLESARDITENKAQISDLSNRLSTEELLVKCIRMLGEETDMDTAVNRFLETIGTFYHASRAYIFEFNYGQNTMDNSFEWCAPGITREREHLQGLPILYVENWLRKFEECGSFFINSLKSEMDTSSIEFQILSNQGIESLLAAPLIKEGRTVGFLGVDNPEENCSDFTLLCSTAEFIAEELEKRRLMKELEFASYTDLLTGLKNRNQYIKVLHQLEREELNSAGVVFIDINGMKRLNDTYGHKYGDYIIIKVAEILKECMRDNIFRIGGDEFVVLCLNEDREAFQRKVLALRKAFDEDRDCDVSIGCTWKAGELNINDQILQADDLMYAEKQSYYQMIFRNGHTARIGLASEVLKELEDDQFVVFFQPQMNIRTGKIVGAEALVRKKEHNGVLIPPDQFIPFYEIEGVIRHVDFYVLRTVCAAMKKWREEGIELKISVNFSRVTLMEPDVVKSIGEICSQYGVKPESITIEVTESISKMDHEQLQELVREIGEAGFSISLDDFGSKYSNLAILTALKFDEIKFDKSLVDDLEKNTKSRIVMKNSIQMLQDLKNTHSLAEGIETQGQRDLLADYDCDYGQGFYFSKPLSMEAFSDLLRENAGLQEKEDS